jgi:tripartite-type tricarboxylate transporter receptor subunit TctC
MDRRLIIACNKFAFEALVVVSVCLLATSLALSGVAHGDEYPSRAITLVAPSTPGSAPDVLARIVAHQLSEQLGQQVVVLNRPGAGTNIGTASVAQAEPDGYTLLLGSIANTLNPHIMRSVGYRLQDLAPISSVAAAAAELPTVAESGLPGFDVVAWFGLFAPAGTPKPIIDRLSTETRAALAVPEVRKLLVDLGAEPLGSTPETFAAYVNEEYERWGKLAKEADIHAD